MTKDNKDINVVELFAGVGGFRIGLEGASDHYKTIWFNQWEPSTQHQDAHIVYQARFGNKNFSNLDINLVKTKDIPDCDLLVGGFPCQDYSVAATLSKSGGIEGKKGVLWWQIYRILEEKGADRPQYVFFENVDRLLNSPADQRGRDFAIILASLSDLGYRVEWRVINAADYGMPQRRRRTYILGYLENSVVANKIEDKRLWVLHDGVLANAFQFTAKEGTESEFSIDGSVQEVSKSFNEKRKDISPFGDAGVMINRQVYSVDIVPVYDGPCTMLGDVLVDEQYVPDEFFIDTADLPKWEYEKGAKKIERTSKEGYKYIFTEGGMAFPDSLDKPSRTMITGEGGNAPSRFKHVVQTPSGRFRRLIPIELERLNMFPDNHTYHHDVSDGKRAFLMGNALVCGIVEEVGKSLYQFIYDEAPVSSHPINRLRDAQPKLDFALFDNESAEILVKNTFKKTYTKDVTKRLLVGYVKADNVKYFESNDPEKIYYTGPIGTFPSTIALNKLYYFMPYITGKGIRDLYMIKIARMGYRKEGQIDANPEDVRLVFELVFLEQLFSDYRKISFNHGYAFRDTTLGRILEK